MNKHQHKKRLKNKDKLAEISHILETTRQNFHRELLLVAKYADKRLADRVKSHFEIADEYAQMRCYHEKEQLKRVIKEFEAAIYNLNVTERNFGYQVISLIIINTVIIVANIIRWLTFN